MVPPCLRRSALTAMIALAACGDPPARVALAPLGGDCARPPSANAVEVIAYTAGGERVKSVALTESVAISDFPADTEQIGVEVLVGGGAVGAAGKSAPLSYGALADGAAIPVMMAPPDGFCELAGMTEARAQPLVARAGDGALVVGGTGPSGPLSTAEYYDRVTATFSPVEVPAVLAGDQGFTGASLATLPDGRVAVIGGPRAVLVVFDPVRRAFVTAPTLIDAWLFAAAIAVGDQEVLVAGGCAMVTGTQCVPRLQTRRYPLNQLGASELSAILTAGPRISPQLFDLGIQQGGKRRYLLAGGTGAADHADRFALDGNEPAEAVPGGHAQAAALDGGAVLTAFGDDAAAVADGTAAVYAPDAAAFRPIASAPKQQGTRLIALEDGRVAGFGLGVDAMGNATGQVVTYDPTRDAWTAAMHAAETGALSQPSLVRLADGTILVVGGAVSQRAWIYRPSLVGPASGSVTAIPASDVGAAVLTAPDPATVTRTANPAAWRLATPAGATMARALVGGPRMAVGSVRASVHVVSGGVALIAQETGPGQAIVAELAPGAPPRLVRLEAGAEHVVCSAADAQTFDPAAPVTLELAIGDHDARLRVGAREVLACALVATDRGAWGIASLGDGAELTVDTVTVARGQPAT